MSVPAEIAHPQASLDEIKDLSRSKRGGDALMLLMLLRAEHTARVRRGETFAINPRRMSECRTLHWTEGRFREARDALICAKYLKVVEPGQNTRCGRRGAQYTLVEQFPLVTVAEQRAKRRAVAAFFRDARGNAPTGSRKAMASLIREAKRCAKLAKSTDTAAPTRQPTEQISRLQRWRTGARTRRHLAVVHEIKSESP